MANFIAKVYATLKDNGIETKELSIKEAIEKYNELEKDGNTGQKAIDDNKIIGYNVNRKELNTFIERYSNDEIEHAVIILPNGSVTRHIGDATSVLNGNNGTLKGAIVLHNHPAKSTAYSFSKEDVDFFLRNELEELYGVDNKYIYVLSRTNKKVDEEPDVSEDEEENRLNYLHSLVINRANIFNFGYRRFKI